MINPSCYIRNYRPGDFNNYFQLHCEASGADPCSASYLKRSLLETLNRPNCSPRQNLFIAESDEKIIGFCNLTPELEIGRVLFDFMVHPLFRRKGIATMLLWHAIRRARDLNAKTAHVNIAEDNEPARNFVSGLGFQPVRHFIELRLRLSGPAAPEFRFDRSKSRSLKAGEEGMLTEIQNRFFNGSWGFKPNTKEEVVYRLNLSDCSPECVILLFEGDKKPVGYCWTTVNAEENQACGIERGRIHMMGVDPDCRNKGLGREVLIAGLSYLKGRGIEVVELTVDSENKAALAIYESMGFRAFTTTIWYEKRPL